MHIDFVYAPEAVTASGERSYARVAAVCDGVEQLPYTQVTDATVARAAHVLTADEIAQSPPSVESRRV